MLTRRLLQIVLVAALVAPSCVFALGVGQLEVRSAINQPLDAELPLIVNNPAEVMGLTVQVPRQEDFDRIGIERLAVFSKLRFTVNAPPGGRPVVKITSVEPMRNPNFSLLVEMVWPRGRLIRQFPVQLDPELYANRQPPPPPPPPIVVAAAPAAAPAETARSAPPPPQLPPAPPVSFDGATTYGPVRRGETLSNIARRVRPSGAISVPQMMSILLAGNPNAFANGNPNLLQVGSTLRVPTPQALGVTGAPPVETVATVPSATLETTPPPSETTTTVTTTVTPPSTPPAEGETPPVAPPVTPPPSETTTTVTTTVTPPSTPPAEAVTPPPSETTTTVTTTVTPPSTPSADGGTPPVAPPVTPPPSETTATVTTTVTPPSTPSAEGGTPPVAPPVTPPPSEAVTPPAGGPQEIVPQAIAPVVESPAPGSTTEVTPPVAPPAEASTPVTPPAEATPPVAPVRPAVTPPPPPPPVQAEPSWLENPLMWLALAFLGLAVAALILLPLMRRRARIAAEAEESTAFEQSPTLTPAAIENPFAAPSSNTQTQVRDPHSVRSGAAALGAGAAALGAAAAATTPSQRSQTPRPIKEVLKDFDAEPDSERLPPGLASGRPSLELGETSGAPDARRRPVDVFAEPPTEPLTKAAPPLAPSAPSSSAELPSALQMDGLNLDLNEFSFDKSARSTAAELPPLEMSGGAGAAGKPLESPFLDLSMAEPATEPPILEPPPRQDSSLTLELPSLRGSQLVDPITEASEKPSLNFEFSDVTQDLSQHNEGQDQLRLDEDLKSLGGVDDGLDVTVATPSAGAGLAGGMSNADYVETKLDLAAAYLDMGDKAGARSLIDEVLREGDAAQKQRGEEFLKKLG